MKDLLDKFKPADVRRTSEKMDGPLLYATATGMATYLKATSILRHRQSQTITAKGQLLEGYFKKTARQRYFTR